MAWNIGRNEKQYKQLAKFWKIQEDKGTWASVSLGTSKKDKEKNWHNSNWGYVRFVGNAYDGLDELKEGDMIEIISGLIDREPYDKEGVKTYPKNEKITVFAWEKYEPENRDSSSNMDAAPKMADPDDFPF